MKTFKALLLGLMLTVGAVSVSAQCSLQAEFGYFLNPNQVPQFIDSTQYNFLTQPTHWEWYFGDGIFSTLQNPTHSFAQSGTYTVCLTVTATSNGVTCRDSICHVITITGNACANTHASFTASASGNTVVLQSTSTTPTGTGFQWRMDGQSMSNVSPSNSTYTLTNIPYGNHNFCLVVFAPNSTVPCDDTCQTILVPGSGPCGGVAPTFNHYVVHDSLFLSATGTYQTTTEFQWWLDGQPTAISTNNRYYVFTGLAIGQHQVCLYIYGPGNTYCDSTCHVFTIASPCAGLNAQFTQTYVNNGGVRFISANQANSVQYFWDFGDGQTSNLADPTHYYNAAGLYNVCLRVVVPGTTCGDSSCHQVQANAGMPCSGFSATIAQGTTPLGNRVMEVILTGGNAPYSYLWNTGEVTRTINVTSGLGYCVTVTDANGCTAIACDSATVGGCHIPVTIVAQGSVLQAVVNNTNAGIAFSWSNGNTSPILTVTTPGTYCVTATDTAGCTGTACYQYTGSNLGTDTICGVIFEDVNGNGVMDSTEHGIPGARVFAGNYSAYTDSFGHYFLIVPAGTYNINYCAPTGFTYTLPVNPNNNGSLCASYPQTVVTGGRMHCGFNFGIQNNYVTICGVVYMDGNNNQTRDSLESGLANIRVTLTSSTGHSYYAYTNAHGEYCITLPAGIYTITTYSNTYTGCVTTPQNISVSATTVGQFYGHNDFGVYCQPGLCNLNINITPHTTITSGFRAWYDIQVCNIGTSVSSGTVNLFYDPAVTFTNASPAPASQNSSTRTVTWNVANLAPGACRYYWAYFDANLGLQIGAPIFTLVNITPDQNCNDINMSNNVDTVHQAVTGSWDPNNKFAYVSNHETNPSYQYISSINADQRLEYVINFQNLGNGPAVNVVVVDELSADLDMSSFEFLGASHPCVVTSAGSELNFRFSDIMLPAEMDDEPASHGWVKFAINSQNGLSGGHVISDYADIYFDFNLPVTTNDAAVTMLDASAVNETKVAATILVAPNPMGEYTTIRVNGLTDSKFRFRVTDMTGRVVADMWNYGNTMQFNRGTLAGGIYTYEVIESNQQIAKGKLVLN